MDLPLDISFTTIGSAVLGMSVFASTVVWKMMPARPPKVSVELLEVELKHLRQDVDVLKKDVKTVLFRLR
jgi:hypothetical protein